METKMNILIRSREDYINKFNNKRISPELNDYILDECKTINPNCKISININLLFKMTLTEKQELVAMIKSSCKDDIEEMELLSKRFLLVDLITLLFGILCLIAYFLVKDVPILSEIILIAGWVLIWEAIYNFIYDRTSNRIKIKRRKQIINSEFEFK